MRRNLTLEIGYDYDVEVPDSGYDGWKLISFGRKHTNFEHPDNYVKTFDRGTREVTPANIGIRRKLDVGLAFWLSYYEHGQGAWSLIGEGNRAIVKSCVLTKSKLSGVLQHSVHKNPSLEKQRQLLRAMESVPFFLSGLGEFEHHGQARFPCAIALGSAVA